MRVFGFISRHTPTARQIELAGERGVYLIHIGDLDAFTVTPTQVHALAVQVNDGFGFDGVVVVHPAAALRLRNDYAIGVFENANRAPVGDPPQFGPVAFHIYG